LSNHDSTVAASILNSSDTQATSGQGVKTWQDQAGSGYHLQQLVAGNRPTLDTGGTIFSNPCISFDDVSGQFLLTLGITPASAVPFTMFLTWAPITGIGANAIIYNSGQAGIGSLFYESTGTNTFFMNAGGDALGAVYTPGTKYVTALVWNGASCKHFQNGVSIGTANAGSRALAGFSLGAYIAGSDAAKIKVAQCLHYSGALSDANVGIVSTYMTTRHGV
jgi:hypothetical protein